MSLACAFCGSPLRSTAKICVNCGEVVSAGSIQPSPNRSSSSNINDNSAFKDTSTTEGPVFEKSPVAIYTIGDFGTKSVPLEALHQTDTVKISSQGGSKLLLLTPLVLIAIFAVYFLVTGLGNREIAKPETVIQSNEIPSNVAIETVIASSALNKTIVCEVLNDCLLIALHAAPIEDIEVVRKVAARLDELDKPVQGNRALSRKINAEALAAFNREDYSSALDLFKSAFQENPRDVEIAANYGFTLIKANRLDDALDILSKALILDPRRTSTWTPLAEAYALKGRRSDALSAMWIGYQWSNDREKSVNYYITRIEKEQGQNPQIVDLYTDMLAWAQGKKPVF